MTNFLSLATFLIIFGYALSNPTDQQAAGNVAQVINSEVIKSNVAESAVVKSEVVNSNVAPSPVNEPNLKSKDVNTTENEVDEIEDESWEFENTTVIDTRRILYSKRVKPGARPYMVYLQLTKESAKAHKYRGWLCGGVIVDQFYVLTSAACVEDAEHFYIVSGTTRFVDSFDYKSNDCVCKNRRKVVWKCIPKNYKFDFQDSIKWSSNDIAIVKVDKAFKFGVVEKACEFATDVVCYNNVSRDLEKPGTKGFIAGWGSGNNFREGVYRRQKESIRPENAKCLQEAKVCVMDNELCAKKWAQRFRSIITQYMICTKDVMKRLSELCDKRYANCTDVESRRQVEAAHEKINKKTFNVDLGRHLRDPDDYTARRSSLQGGFCEWVNRRSDNQQNLLEAQVEVIPKQRCKRRWGSKYHNIIDNYMICSKDLGQTMSEICNEKYVDCQDINYSDEDEDNRRRMRRTDKIPTNLFLHSALHNESVEVGGRRAADGGFCENDHGGPLVYGTGVNAMVIGIISACLVKERSNKCYGPFLYTSVYKNRQFISCAIYKDVEPKCRRQFRSGVTHVETVLSWKNHPDGPAKHELETNTEKKVEEPVAKTDMPKVEVAPVNATSSKISAIPLASNVSEPVVTAFREKVY